MPAEEEIQRAILSLMYEEADTLIASHFMRRSIVNEVSQEFDDGDENEILYALTILEEDMYIERDGQIIELTLSGVEKLQEMGGDVLLNETLQYEILDVLLEEKRTNPVHPELTREELYERLEPESEAVDENVWALQEQLYVELQQFLGSSYHSVSITSSGRNALERYSEDSESVGNIAEILGINEELAEVNSDLSEETSENGNYDVFISHASEDKDEFVRPLANNLDERGLNIWYDEFELSLGDSLSTSIDEGLSSSDYGIVVLSKSFFDKEWTEYELRGLRVKDMGSEKSILPLWHEVDRTDVADYSPTLADKYAIRTENSSIDEIAQTIYEEIASE